jgi:hypothetical protein
VRAMNWVQVSDASMEVCLEINVEKTKYVLMFRHQIIAQNLEKEIAHRSFWNNSKNQNFIQQEIKRRLNSGNACYHSVQNISSSRLLSKDVKIRI